MIRTFDPWLVKWWFVARTTLYCRRFIASVLSESSVLLFLLSLGCTSVWELLLSLNCGKVLDDETNCHGIIALGWGKWQMFGNAVENNTEYNKFLLTKDVCVHSIDLSKISRMFRLIGKLLVLIACISWGHVSGDLICLPWESLSLSL